METSNSPGHQAGAASQVDEVSKPNAASELTAKIVRATQYGDLDLFRSLIESGYDVNQPDNERITLLHWAAINNRLDFVTYMLSKGAHIDATGGELRGTPLHWAIRQGHIPMTILLIQNGANPSIVDLEGYNALHLAAIHGKTAIIAYLLASGADVDAVDKNGMTVLMWAAYKIYSADPIRLLLHFQAKLNARDRAFGNTAFAWAAISGNAPAVRALFQAGADASVKNDKGFDPPAIALQFRQYGVYSDLVSFSGESAVQKRGFPLSLLCSQRARTNTAFIIPTITFLLVCFVLSTTFAWWLKLIGLVLVFMATSVLVQLAFDSSYSQKLPFGLMVTTKAMLLLSFYFIMQPQVNETLTYGFYFSFGATLILAMLIRSKSKHSRVPAPNIQDKSSLLKKMAENPKEVSVEQFCSTCLIRRPLRSKHCSICNCCVVMFDHHSSWLYTCIGWKNQKLYATYLFVFIGTLALYLYSCSQFWANEFSIDYAKCETYGEILVKIIFASNVCVTLAALNCFIHLAWSGLYLLFLLHQVSFVGMTTNERFNAFRNRVFQTDKIGVFRSPFNRGILQNWVDFCELKMCGRQRAAVDWLRIFSVDDYYKQVRFEMRRDGKGRLLPV